MALALAGDERAYAALLAQMARLFTRMVAGKVSPKDREDVVQDMLLSLHKARHTYDPARAFLPWAMAIARYRLQDHWRAHYRHNQQNMVQLDEAAENYVGEDVTESLHWREDLRRGMAGLSPRQQEILSRMYGQDQSVLDVANHLKINVSAVKVAAHRAYKALRQTLGER